MIWSYPAFSQPNTLIFVELTQTVLKILCVHVMLRHSVEVDEVLLPVVLAPWLTLGISHHAVQAALATGAGNREGPPVRSLVHLVVLHVSNDLPGVERSHVLEGRKTVEEIAECVVHAGPNLLSRFPEGIEDQVDHIACLVTLLSLYEQLIRR